jgi:DNA-binding PadR family transcriptional regulator
MAKISPYESGELTDSIFLILLATIAPAHGYKIMQDVQTMTKKIVEIGPATMYTTLKKLNQAGWISEISGDDSKILYVITDSGKKVLQDNYEYRKSIVRIAEKQIGGIV